MTTAEKKIIDNYTSLQKKYDEAVQFNQTDDEAKTIFPKLSRLKEKALLIKLKYSL